MKHYLYFLSFFVCCYFGSCKKDPSPGAFKLDESYLLKGGFGDTIKLTGNDLDKHGSLTITINDKPVAISKMGPRTIAIVVPKLLGSGAIKINAGGKSYEGPFFYYNYKATVTTLAGSDYPGTSDGTGSAASFYCPWGITVDENDNLFVADNYNRLIRKIAVGTGRVSTIAIPHSINGGSFYSPYNIAVDTKTHSLYVTDFNQHLMRITSDNEVSLIYNTSNIATSTGVAVGPDGSVYMSLNTAGTILKFDPKNNYSYITLSSGLVNPRNIIFDKNNNMFVSAFDNLLGPVIVNIANDGQASVTHSDLNSKAWEIAVDKDGIFYEADHFSNNLRIIEKNGRSVVIAGSGEPKDVDGLGIAASFNGPQGITIDSKGNLYITTYNYDTRGGNKVRKVVVE